MSEIQEKPKDESEESSTADTEPKKDAASKVPSSPAFNVGCLLGLVGICLIFALPRFSVSLLVIGCILCIAYAESGPKSAGTRFTVLALVALVAIMGYAGIRKDFIGHKLPAKTQEKPKNPVSSVKSTYKVVYEVSGSASSASLTYRNATGGTDQKEVGLPWESHFDAGPGAFLYVSAQNQDQDGSIRVAIKVDGLTVQYGETNADYGIATASGRI